MSTKSMTITGLFAGVMMAGAVGMLMSGGKSATQKIAKSTVKAAETVGDRMQSIMMRK